MINYKFVPFLLFFVILTSCSKNRFDNYGVETQTNKELETSFQETKKTENPSTLVVKENENLESNFDQSEKYDNLQKLYLEFNHSWDHDVVIQKIKELNLLYEEEDFSDGKSIKVAFDKSVTPFRHAKFGDDIEIHYDKNFSFDSMSYFNSDSFISLLDYQKGTYYDFRDNVDYKGLYINILSVTLNDNIKEKRVVIKYPDGYEVKTDYIKANSKQEQFDKMKKYEDIKN
ncbi:hypothetical protein [Floricoccus penangensis]|uniref:hypothetical protein n=1 Tax=Floricoccus penangensis TaxID=1859475 RepID=UPI00203B65F7|nr:hypothetical protein [Floricoccus penangensis]URZ86982.1 hypothetical protein KIW23_07815 [Floricoccus penangensis]